VKNPFVSAFRFIRPPSKFVFNRAFPNYSHFADQNGRYERGKESRHK
jgi:hypothetical protein